MGFKDYNGSVSLIAGLKPEAEGYPLMQTCDIQAEEGVNGAPGRRLDALLTEIYEIATSGAGSGRPIVVESEAEMNAVLDSATTDNVGMVYKYMGEESEIYEIGALYIIELEVPDGDEVNYNG